MNGATIIATALDVKFGNNKLFILPIESTRSPASGRAARYWSAIVAHVKTLVVHSHPLEESYSAALRDMVCEGLTASDVDHTLASLDHGDEPHLGGGSVEHLIAVCPTWWGGPPAIMLDWLQRQLAPFVDAHSPPASSPLRSVRRLSVVTTHGSSLLINRLQGQPGMQTWQRVVVPLCHPDAEFDWISYYKIDRSTAEERAAFLTKVRATFTTVPVPA